MVETKRRFVYIFLFIFLFNVLIVDRINAFGVSHSFICPDEPVRVYPGQETNVKLGMQNMGVQEGEDVNVKVTIRDSEGIAELEDKNYIVKANTKDTKIDVKIKIPEDAQIGNKYNVVVGFDNLESGEKGGVAISTGIDVKICLIVLPEYPVGLSPTGAKTISVSGIALIIFLIIFTIIVSIIWKRRKNNNLVSISSRT